MAIVLPSKPGLSSATTLSIPKDWDATWFRNLINNQLKGADVRNASGTNGITVSGTIASPYATISIGGSPIVLPAVAGQTTLTVNGAASQVAIKAVAGAGGDGLDVTPSAGGNAIGISLGTGTAFNALVVANLNGKFVADILANGNFEMGTFSSDQLSFFTNNATRVMISATGAVTINAPTSGVGLTLSGVAGSQIGVFNGVAGNSYFDYQRSSVLTGRIGSADSVVSGGASTDFGISCPAGGFNIATGAGSNSALTLSNTGQFGLPLANVTSTSPAAGGAGALPATPAGYMAITIAGVARRIPFYT